MKHYFNLLSIALLILTASVFSQDKTSTQYGKDSLAAAKNGFTITGSIPQLESDMVYLVYRVSSLDGFGTTFKDSALLYNGNFEFSGPAIPQPTYCSIENKEGNPILMFWLENANTRINSTGNGKMWVEGSKTEDEYNQFNEVTELVPLRNKVTAIKEELAKATEAGDEQKIKALEKQIESYVAQWNSNCEKFVKENPGSYISVNFIWNRTMLDKIPYDELYRLYQYLNSETKNSISGKILLQRLEKMKPLTVGERVPDFSQPDANGKPAKLSDYRGKVLLLSFSGSWNEPYRKDNIRKKELYDKFHSKGFEIMDVLFESKKDGLVKVMEEDKIPWKVVSDLKSWNNALAKQFAIESIPRMVLIDKNGFVIANSQNLADLEAQLSALFPS